MYKIKPYSFEKAKELGVIIKPSEKKGKKIDVFKNDKLITSIGAIGYSDYPTYLEKDKKIAKERRRLYKIRHEKNKGISGYYADKILW